jgi:hypothetical protein
MRGTDSDLIGLADAGYNWKLSRSVIRLPC